MAIIVLKYSKQLQGYRYGQEDDAEESNVAIDTVHPLGWIWNKTGKRQLYEYSTIK